MAANKVIRVGPVAMVTGSTPNLINCNVTAVTGPTGFTMTQPYLIIRHIRLVNKTAGAITVSLYIGATTASAAGTEFLGTALSIAANSSYDWYGLLRLDAADYLTGSASANTSITFEAEGEAGIV